MFFSGWVWSLLQHLSVVVLSVSFLGCLLFRILVLTGKWLSLPGLMRYITPSKSIENPLSQPHNKSLRIHFIGKNLGHVPTPVVKEISFTSGLLKS